MEKCRPPYTRRYTAGRRCKMEATLTSGIASTHAKLLAATQAIDSALTSHTADPKEMPARRILETIQASAAVNTIIDSLLSSL